MGRQLNLEDWAWKLTENTLEPIQTILPDKFLITIFFAITKKVAVLNVAVEKEGCCVQQHAVIAMASLARMFNSTQ